MKTLELEHPVDSHLKPLKDSDGNVCPLEMSTDKVRVKDFEVTGTATGITHTDDTKLPLAGGTVSGDLEVTGAFTSQGIDDNANANAITIDSNERVGIGTGSVSMENEMHIIASDKQPVLMLESYSTTNNHQSWYQCRKSDSNTPGTLAETDSGDTLGGFLSYGVSTGTGSPGWGASSYFQITQTGVSSGYLTPSKFELKTTTTSAVNDALSAGDDGVVDIETGLKVGGSTVTITDIENNDSLGTSDVKLCTQGNVKAYADTMLPLAGGTMTGDLILTGVNTDVIVAATAKLRLDGSASGDTYIYQSSGDTVILIVGGEELLYLDEGGATGNMVYFKDSCATFTQITETFDATPITSTSGSNDTDIDFRFTNKIKLAVTDAMNDMNLIFPGAAGNFQLVVTYNGNHDIDSWKVFDKTGSAVTNANVLWAGGSEPDTTASGVDIFSFYWDGETAYGVASLNFVAGN